MAVRFAMALEISVDQLLRPASSATVAKQSSRENAAPNGKDREAACRFKQSVLLKTIDMFIENAALKSAAPGLNTKK